MSASSTKDIIIESMKLFKKSLKSDLAEAEDSVERREKQSKIVEDCFEKFSKAVAKTFETK